MKKKSRTVPKELKEKYEAIVEILNSFCEKKLNSEYYELSCDLCAALSRKRPSPLLRGKANTWACGIIHALGTVNFLFDPEQSPHITPEELYASFGITSSTALSKSKLIRDIFNMIPFEPDWTIPSNLEDNPFVWTILLDGVAIDVRKAPKEIQEEAYRQGIIPYIPGESKAEENNGKIIEFPKKRKANNKTPEERLRKAEELAYDVFQTEFIEEKIRLAHKALNLSEDCAAAYMVLAEAEAQSFEEEKELYEKAVEAAKRVLGEEMFKEDEGHFWLIRETRTYMIAKWHLADTLWALGNRKEAIEHLKDMLRLNPNDNQGVRYIIINWLIMEEGYEYIEKLLNTYEGDTAAAFKYGTALYYFKKGDRDKAAKELKEALEVNKYVPQYLLGTKRMPQYLPEYIGFGDESEAQAYMVDAFDTWEDTKGALSWLREEAEK